jgi:hypothetical protein
MERMERMERITNPDGQEHLGQLLAVQWATSRDETDADHASMFGPMNVIDDADLTEI